MSGFFHFLFGIIQIISYLCTLKLEKEHAQAPLFRLYCCYVVTNVLKTSGFCIVVRRGNCILNE